MTAEQDGIDPAKVQAAHRYHRGGLDGGCVLTGRHNTTDHCLPYLLAALALDLQGKVARVEVYADELHGGIGDLGQTWPTAVALGIRAALADHPEQEAHE